MQTLIFKKVDLHDEELMSQIYRLRYQVYGHECGFLAPERMAGESERDEYDAQSVHFAAVNGYREVIGSMRLILPGPRALPVERYCAGLDHAQGGETDRSLRGEISRLVVGKRLRRRTDNLLTALGTDRHLTRQERGFLRYEKAIVLGLCRAVYRECQRRGIVRLYALMEKSLWGLLRLYRLRFSCIGEEVDVFGPVRPYTGQVRELGHAIMKYYFPEDPWAFRESCRRKGSDVFLESPVVVPHPVAVSA